MVDYQKMYYILCRAASDAIDKLPETKDNQEARKLLQTALLEAEEKYTFRIRKSDPGSYYQHTYVQAYDHAHIPS